MSRNRTPDMYDVMDMIYDLIVGDKEDSNYPRYKMENVKNQYVDADIIYFELNGKAYKVSIEETDIEEQ